MILYIILYLGNNLQAYEEGEQQQVKVLFLKDYYSYKKINVIIFFFLFSAISYAIRSREFISLFAQSSSQDFHIGYLIKGYWQICLSPEH